MKFMVYWYNKDEVVTTDTVDAENKEEAEKQAYLKYNGNPPGECVSIYPI